MASTWNDVFISLSGTLPICGSGVWLMCCPLWLNSCGRLSRLGVFSLDVLVIKSLNYHLVPRDSSLIECITYFVPLEEKWRLNK